MPTLATGGDESAAEIELLAHSLERLRTREGLELVRLQSSARENARQLTALTAVRRLVGLHNLDESAAAVHVVRYCIGELLPSTDRIVADVVLAAGVLREVFGTAGVSRLAVTRLYSANLTTRRGALLQNWAQLHNAIGSEVPPLPADRTLRGQLEPTTLRLLARVLWRLAPERVPTPAELQQVARAHVQQVADDNEVLPSRGSVVVVGGAVMDATFRVARLPEAGTSGEAYSFDLFPGGKGLTQAVACSRLGLRTEFVAVVGDDSFGDEILALLKNEGVGTAGVRRVPGARTPVTGVVFEARHSIALNWRNEGELALTADDVDAARDRLLAADVVLVTFEPPAATVEYLFSDVFGHLDEHPRTVLTPAPPYANQALSGRALSQVNHLVAHRWELDSLVSDLQEPAEHMATDAVADRLLQTGMDAVVVPEGMASTVFAHTGQVFRHMGPPPIAVTAGARDAFVAALALRVVEAGGGPAEEDTAWATLAMAAVGSRRVPLSMPHRRQVDALARRAVGQRGRGDSLPAEVTLPDPPGVRSS